MNSQFKFRAPSPEVEADLRRMFEHVGLPHPYGPPLTFDDVFNLIEEKYGTAAARKCRITITLH
jgi:hypothetical protein